MEKHLRLLMLLEAVEKSTELQDYFSAGEKDTKMRAQALADIQKWYGLSEEDLQGSKAYLEDYFGESRAFRFIWF